jgi:hypothetical protein
MEVNIATQDDILTAQKNQVVATNGLNQTWINYQRGEHGDNISKCVTGPTMIAVGPGRLVLISVVDAGTAEGFVYNQAAADTPDATNRIAAIPKTEGIYPANFVFSDGLLIVPGAGQAVTVSYTTD